MALNLLYDIFDAEVIKDAEWCGEYDFPRLKPSMAHPMDLLSFDHRSDPIVRSKTFLNFYNFDKRFLPVMRTPEKYLLEFKEFAGLIGLDCSHYRDLPRAQQIYHVYCNRVLDAYWQQNGIEVVPNISWANSDSFPWCCDGVATKSTIAVSSLGTVKNRKDRFMFLDGFYRMAEILCPKKVVYYGSVLPDIVRCSEEYSFELLLFKSRIMKAHQKEAL